MSDPWLARKIVVTLTCSLALACGRGDGETGGQRPVDSVLRATAPAVMTSGVADTAPLGSRGQRDVSAISIVFSSDASGALGEFIATLLIADGQGQRTGFDVASGDTLQEIPRAWYGDEVIEDPVEEGSGIATRTIEIMSPARGTYTLSVHATGGGTYNLSIRGYNTAVEPSTRAFRTVTIEAGATHSYVIAFDPVSGIAVSAPGR